MRAQKWLTSRAAAGPDPHLTGVSMAEMIRGIQESGVIACAKHYILNEQERNREPDAMWDFAYSSNVDDALMHEFYLL